MKKLILILALTLWVGVSFSQEKKKNSYDKTVDKISNGVDTVYKDLKSTAPKITATLSSLGTSLKVGAEKVWDILVKQQLVWSIAFLILTITSIFNWILFYYRNFRTVFIDSKNCIVGQKDIYDKIINPEYNTYSNSFPKNQEYILGLTGGKEDILMYPPKHESEIKNFKYLHLGICIVLSCLSIYHFNDMLTGFINPEYGAIKTIATIASQLK